MATYKQMVKARLEADTAQARVLRYLEEMYNKSERAAAQFKTTSARESVNGTIALDLGELTFGVIDAAKKAGDEEVEHMLPKDVQTIIVDQRKSLFYTARANQAFMISLAKSEERKGLSNTAGQA